MADFTQLFDDLKNQLGLLAEEQLKEFAGEGKTDAMAFLEESRAQLEEWFDLLANDEIDEEEFRELVETQKDLARMEGLRKTSAGQQKVENFRDATLNLIVKAAIVAAVG